MFEMKNLRGNIKYNLSAMSYTKFFCLSTIPCSILVFLNVHFLKAIGRVNLFNLIFIIFCGPKINEKRLFISFEWIFMNLIILALFSNVTFHQIFERGSLVISRVLSKTDLWVAQIVSLLIMIIGYFIMQFLVTILIGTEVCNISTNSHINLINKIYTINTDINKIKIIIILFVLLILSSVSIILFQSTLSLILKNPVIALVITLIVQFFTLNSGEININVMRWLPGNQGILLRHDSFSASVVGFSVAWSIVYNLIFILILSLIGFFYIKGLDIY
jgi:hypothetical protein